MSSFRSEFSDDGDEEDFDDFDEAVGDSNDDEPTIRCSHCGFEMLEIAWQCPRCGEIPTAEFRQTWTQPRWVIITALLVLGSMLWWLLRHW
ncbi:MAG: hypothetical protein KDB01_17670 [Planctomycetaceae bacterium]|nr:hypothetical protein [Planctomycetaceae bacterium]